jgi:hypothetical protein
MLMSLETLVFTHGPFNQSAVDPIHGVFNGRKMKSSKVVQPSPD